MLTEPNASALNCDRVNVLRALEEMEDYIAQAKVAMAKPITVESNSISHPNLTRFLAVSMRVTERIADFDKSVAGRIR